MHRYFTIVTTLAAALVLSSPANGAEVVVLDKSNWAEFAPAGKEADAIYGDIVLRNDQVVAVIATPTKTRNANMTVRNVGGCLIDFTQRGDQNDQLSAYYPTGGLVPFRSLKHSGFLIDGEASHEGGKGKTIAWECFSAISGKPMVKVRYSLSNGDDFLTVKTTYENKTETKIRIDRVDSLRADRTFAFSIHDATGMYIAEDDWFEQSYGVVAEGYTLKRSGSRGVVVAYEKDGESKIELAPGDSFAFSRKIMAKRNLLELLAVVADEKAAPATIVVRDSAGTIAHAAVSISQKDGAKVGRGRTNAKGQLQTKLPAGEYSMSISAVGRPATTVSVKQATSAAVFDIVLERPGFIVGEITDDKGGEIPCKVALHGVGDTPTPDWGPDSAANPVKNLYYSHNGKFRQAILPGKYEAIISCGPEFDAVFVDIEVEKGEETKIAAKLKRVVDSSGWISADYHSHSSPSGDNTSDQRGRVLNLLGENIEFAPCTEHNRIDSYRPHLKALGAERFMATITGMELTGSPLPVNHQNAFPLIHKPHTQDGGGPVTDSNPVVQIERLAMWDDKSAKVIQGNHPTIARILGDKNEDGKPDGGYEPMLGYMDVMEVHPPEGIFAKPPTKKGEKPSRMFAWMQLLNVGYRLPGVVNTDAHYNEHGSGWLRNYIQSSTDAPAEISIPEMIEQSEAGHITITNGPFLEVLGTWGKNIAHPGDDLAASDGKVKLSVRVQCANWLDINRVQVFINGKPDEKLNFTRREHPDMFSTDVVRFEHDLPVNLKKDAHIIVAAIGEGLSLGRIMGTSRGKAPPVAVSNPIFVDVDGEGFQANGDDLGHKLPIDEKKFPLHRHHHHHHDHDHDHDHPHQ